MTSNTGMRPSPVPPATASADVVAGKVRKLLAMAEGTSNAAEADAFSRKAAELIAQHRLDPARLVAGNEDPLAVLEVSLGRGAYVRARLRLLQIVAEAHGCTVVFRAGYHGTTALVAGFRSDLDTVEMLYTSLHTQAASRMAAERRATGASTQRWRRSFLFGYADQVAAMLVATDEAAQAASPPDGHLLPALLDRKRRVDEFASQQFGRVTSARPVVSPTPVGYVAGRAAAAAADMGRPMVPGRRGLGRGG